ncbi:unnamed protein product [Lactuca saligna]|uniref:Uncharacterized protein n=1 Tax=Lactuca saligna TaxID=75948 RepID=A0AA35Y4J5_LACSI|nr:unnamed protein product [Lactuca saligna]
MTSTLLNNTTNWISGNPHCDCRYDAIDSNLANSTRLCYQQKYHLQHIPVDKVKTYSFQLFIESSCDWVKSISLSDYLILKVIKVLPQEIETLRKPKWDAVLVSQYFSDLKEVKKQGRKERRNKEAQGVLAASTAVAAASSRISSFWKDTLKESAHYENKLKIKALGGRSAVH